MKIYLTSYRLRKEFAEAAKAGNPMPERDNYDVVFTREPKWTFPDRAWAETELRIVQGMSVHVGNHYCHLELEECEDGSFALVCNEHPNSQQSEVTEVP